MKFEFSTHYLLPRIGIMIFVVFLFVIQNLADYTEIPSLDCYEKSSLFVRVEQAFIFYLIIGIIIAGTVRLFGYMLCRRKINPYNEIYIFLSALFSIISAFITCFGYSHGMYL